MERAPRVLIADDHPHTVMGVRSALEVDGFVVCAEAPDGPAAVDKAVEIRPDVCVLDVNMPGGGIAAAREIKRRVPDTAIVMLTVSEEEDDFMDSLRAGASGYLLKDTDPHRLGEALRQVMSGEAVMPRRLAMRLVEEFRGPGRRSIRVAGNRVALLTSREWEVLELMAEERSTSNIAERLHISPGTVRSHVATVLKKLHVTDRASAIRLLGKRRDSVDN